MGSFKDVIAAGPVSARVIMAIFLGIALVAVAVSGSWFRALQILFEARAVDGNTWQLLVAGFKGDITGTPGLLVFAVKTVFAVIVASGVVRLLPVGTGQLSFEFKAIKLSGAQSAALLWCVVFALVKLL